MWLGDWLGSCTVAGVGFPPWEAGRLDAGGGCGMAGRGASGKSVLVVRGSGEGGGGEGSGGVTQSWLCARGVKKVLQWNDWWVCVCRCEVGVCTCNSA